ncbi:MAG: hypothetical protein ACR2QM_06850, partial [Longimicrobiales bacterium]
MKVLEIPPSLDYRTIEGLYDLTLEAQEGPVLFDARRLRWIDPNGMVGLLATGQVVGERTGVSPRISLPESGDVSGYLGRMGFFPPLAEIFDVKPPAGRRGGRDSDVLLEITPINTNSDVHEVVERVQSRAGKVLSKTLHYP